MQAAGVYSELWWRDDSAGDSCPYTLQKQHLNTKVFEFDIEIEIRTLYVVNFYSLSHTWLMMLGDHSLFRQ